MMTRAPFNTVLARTVSFTACVLASVASAQISTVDLIFDTNQTQLSPTTLGTSFSAFSAQLTAPVNAVEDAEVLVVEDDANYTMPSFGGTFSEVFLYISPTETSQAALLNFFPQSNYVFSWSGGTAGSGSATVNQPFATGLWPSAIPRFTPASYAAAQGHNPALPLSLSVVTPFTPNPQSQYNRGGITIRRQGSGLLLYNTLTTGPNATASTLVIPANTLQPSTAYSVSWMFAQGRVPVTPGVGSSIVQFRYQTSMNFTTGPATPPCDTVDFNNDGVFPDDQDLADFIFVLGGGTCAACNDVDFNNDGVFPDDSDLASFLFVLSGGTC